MLKASHFIAFFFSLEMFDR